MKIQLKNIKTAEFASEETHCYTATLWFDGRRMFTVGNAGHGGCDDQCALGNDTREQFNAKLAEVTDYIKTLPKYNFMGKQMSQDIETICCDLVNAHLATQDAKKLLKKISYVKPDGTIWQQPAARKPTDQNIKMVKFAKWWKPEYILLNDMSVPDVINTLKKADDIRMKNRAQELAREMVS